MTRIECGTVFRPSLSAGYTYVCIFCSEEFETGTIFEEHVIVHFLKTDTDDCNDWTVNHSTTTADYSITLISNEFKSAKFESNSSGCDLKIESHTADDFVQCMLVEEKIDDIHSEDDGIDETNTKDNSNHSFSRSDSEGSDCSEGSGTRGTPKLGRPKISLDIRCGCCNETWACNGLKRNHLHRDYEKDPNKSCDQCPTYFSKIGGLETHKKVHQQLKGFKCQHCGEYFTTNAKLFRHQTQDVAVNWLPSSVTLHGISDRKCPICNENFVCKGLRDQHVQRCHEQSRTITFQCKSCPASFPTEPDLIAHGRVHIETDQRVVCNYCGQVFGSWDDLKQHAPLIENPPSTSDATKQDTNHTGIELYKYKRLPDSSKQYTCDICQKKFSKFHNLKKHLDLHAKNLINKFTCEHCGRDFKTKATLQRHTYTHTGGEKTFHCQICGKDFFKDYKSTHLRIHRGEKKYQCPLCGKSFYTSSKLSTHLKVHKNVRKHNCDMCDRSFMFPAQLNDHIRSQHTGERPFKCDVCESAFSRRKTLHEHKLLHKEKKFKCRYCEQAYAQTSGRRGHEVRVHNAV